VELITFEVLADKIRTYLQHQSSLAELVEWAENAMMDGEFEETNDYAIRDITGRLGVADVQAFSLSKEDFEQFLSQLEHTVRKENGNMATPKRRG
jgi:hypothetical protein